MLVFSSKNLCPSPKICLIGKYSNVLEGFCPSGYVRIIQFNHPFTFATKSIAMKKILLLGYSVFTITTTLFSQGFYIEFKITSTGKESSINGSMKSFAQDGNSRSEVSMSSPQMPGGAMKITSLSLKTEPNKVYLLNEKDKTYSEAETGNDDEWKDRPQAGYEVTVIGKETVNSYSTTHVRVNINGKLREEMWTTKDITGYADFSKIKTKYTGKDNMYKALAAKGADGMPVRIKMQEHGQSIQMDLVKAEKRNNPASLFSLTGYTKGSGFSGMPGGESMQEMMEKLQNMTPQEQEEMMKRLEQQYGKHPH